MLTPQQQFMQANQHLAAGRNQEAVAILAQLAQALPHEAGVLVNLATGLMRLNNLAQAESVAAAAIQRAPQLAEAWNTLGNILRASHREGEAIQCYQRAGTFEAYVNQAQCHTALREYDAAINIYQQLLHQRPNWAEGWAHLYHAACYGLRFDLQPQAAMELRQRFTSEEFSTPLPSIVNMLGDDALHVAAVRRYITYKILPSIPPEARFGTYSTTGTTLRIGYISSDFHEHATAHLIAGMLEAHDKTQFHITLYDTSPNDNSPRRARLLAAADAVVLAQSWDDATLAARIHSDACDILVDLKGFTRSNRLGVLARRPAPIQIHYLGYPGSVGKALVDYQLLDPIIAPDAHAFDEQRLMLPCYQVNDPSRPLPHPTTRKAHGLPEHGVLFGALGGSYKITPKQWALWARILQESGGYLWLLAEDDATAKRLLAHAADAGIAEGHVYIAPIVSQAEHISRLALVDIVLDTSPICGHTTVSDALWAATPVVAMRSHSMTGRISASLLAAAGLADYVATTADAYADKAVALASNAALRQQLRTHLQQARTTSVLFDCTATTRAIEAHYKQLVSKLLS